MKVQMKTKVISEIRPIKQNLKVSLKQMKKWLLKKL